MSAQDFENRVKGKTADEAFWFAVEEALYDYGHSGYTGTIAEKHEFVMIKPKDGETPEACIERLQQIDDDSDTDGNPYMDKWGPSGCIDLGGGEFVFFGCASS